MSKHKAQDVFNNSFRQGVNIGASNFQLQERERIDVEKEQRQIKEKERIKNQQLKMLHEAMGVTEDDGVDPLTKQIKPTGDITDGGIEEPNPLQQELVSEPQTLENTRPSAKDIAIIKSTLTPENARIYGQFIKDKFPAISDQYFGVKTQVHPDGSGGGLYGFDKETGEKKLIRDLPDYKFKPVPNGSYIIYGTADLDGQQIGISGRRTRVVKLEGKDNYTISDLGAIPSGSKDTKDEKTILDYEIKMADSQAKADKLALRTHVYRTTDWSRKGGESAREDYRIGYNSEMNELALRTLNYGSAEAEVEGMRIWQQGRKMIRGGDMVGAIKPTDMTREEYFEFMQSEILANRQEYVEGGWDYKDAQSIIKFLEYKYKGYLPSGESEADNFEFFNSVMMDNEGNIIEIKE